MRLFVAITPPQAALAELEQVLAPLRPQRPDLRWTGSGSWHITLAFLGEVNGSVGPALAGRLERAAARHPAQRLAIEGAGAFPAASSARVLWAGLRVGDDGQARSSGNAKGTGPARHGELAALAASVAAGARRAGAPPPDEGRRYRPHLTLARCREPADLRALTGQLAGFAGTEWTARQIGLIRSYLGPHPRYEQLGSWPLLARPG